MLSVEEISYHCPTRTFHRGIQIADNDRNILTKQCRYGEFETIISAFVVSSSSWADRYRSSVHIDEDNDEIVDYSCTCPAYLKYDGMCKHTVALAVSFSENPASFMGYQARRAPETSPSITSFMQRLKRVSDEDAHGSIELEAIVGYGYENWSVHFKVKGPKSSYVMKSIGEFVEHMRREDHVTYGKKLAFTHTPLMLSEKSRELARFLDRAVAAREQRRDMSFWRASAGSIVGRDLALTEAEAVELFDLIAPGPFTLEGRDYGMRASSRVRIVEEDPHIELKVSCVEGGYIIGRDAPVVFAADGARMYLLQGETLHRCSASLASSADFFRSVYRASDERLFIATEDMPLFCSTVLPSLEKQLAVSVPPEVELYRPVKCQLEFYFDKTRTHVELAANALYGKRVVTLFATSDNLQAQAEAAYLEVVDAEKAGRRIDAEEPMPLRDEKAENTALGLAREFFYDDATISLEDDEAVARLLFGGLALFQKAGSVFTTPAFDRLISDKKPRVSMGLSIAGNLINLDVSADDLPMSEISAMLASYRKRKRFHRLRNGSYLNLEELDLAQLEQLSDDLGISARELSSGHIEIPTYKAFYLDQELGDARRDGSFTRYVNSFKNIDQLAFAVPHELENTLRPYQKEGFQWLSALCDMGFGGILADEMGLGKSVQLISFLLAHRAEAHEAGGTLIVCPASLVYNWLAEFERFAPHMRVRAVVGAKTERALIRADESCEVLVTSYDLLRIDAKDYEGRSFWCHALDEAQYIKNHATLTTRAVKRVQSKHRFALTGTPMENRLSELWSIFDFLMPGLLGSYARFRERYELSVLGGDEHATRRLQALVGPFIMRRLKEDVLPELPEKMESVVYVPLEGEQRRLYAAHEQQLRTQLALQKKENKARKFGAGDPNFNRVEVLAELTKLRQICCDPALLYENYRGRAAKTAAIMELVEQLRDAGKKALVFSQFTSFLERLADELERREMPYYRITGATPKKRRLDLVNAFNEDDTPVFLVSLKAGGTGLNLTGAQAVIHADPWWNLAAQNQATDRAHRIGQERTVNVYRIIAKGTIEERILRLQDAKAELADAVVGEAAGLSLASLTREDLIDLLEG